MNENKNILLEVQNISKRFGATVALNDVSMKLEYGKVYGLIGENGSGKSTLSSIIAGIHTANSGKMFFKDSPWSPSNILDAQNYGIASIVQEAGTIPHITVAENIFLGHEKIFLKRLIINRAKMFAQAQELLTSLGINDFKAETPIDTLTMQDRKLVEIARSVYWKPSLLIIDETTTALSRNGRIILYDHIKRQTKNGKSVLFISHDLEEVMQYCDVITVLRDGALIDTLEKGQFEAGLIKNLMVGRNIDGDYYRSDMDAYSDEVVLKADCITTLKDLLCFSIELHKGEILGIGGLSNCGMHTLGKALFGLEKVLDGEVICRNDTLIKSSKTAIMNKMGYISKNRDRESLGLTATIRENIAILGIKMNSVLGFLVSFRKEKKYVDTQIKELSIKCGSQYHLVNTLSGGNKQKVAFAKWIAADSEILIMDCPTRGVDIGVKASMYKLIHEMKKAGKSILLISEELPEIIGMSDRVIIMKNSEVAYEVLRTEGLSEHKLIEHMI